MKKGFTIIELIAVVTIIAVLIAVAFLMLSGSINSAKVKAYNQNIDKVIETTELYIANGNLDSLLSVGDTAEVTVEELITAGYLKAIKSPFNKSNTCNGYVLVEKTIDDDYLYFPYLNCTADIGNSTEDKLILHYTFDDFQEPTTNVVVRPEFSGTYLGSPWGSWDTTVLTFGAANISGIDTTYVSITKRVTGVVNAIYQGNTTLTNGVPYTLSFYVRIDPESISTTGKIRAYINSYVDYPITKEWTRITLTQTTNSTSQTFHITQYSIAYDVQVALVQFEKKAYATPFINGIREGIVKDYSINSNDGESNGLVPTANSLNQSNKAVEFNGISDYIEIPNYSISNNSTISVWLKATLADGYQIIVGDYNSIAFGLYGNYFIGSTVTSRPLGIINNCFINNEWNHIAVVIENYEIKYYCNNVLLLNTGGNNWSWDDSAFAYVGRRNPATAGAIYYFKGKMSDFRIYERPLSALEIKEIYMLEN